MDERDKKRGGFELTRRGFLKATAAASAVGAGGFEFVGRVTPASAAWNPSGDKTTTCPYCSASCGQRVVASGQDVVEIYGDHESPINRGGLCAKGAGTLQLVNNARRLGVGSGSHPVDAAFAARAETNDGVAGSADDFSNGVAYYRLGNGDWTRVGLDYAMGQIATGMKAARDANSAFSEANGWNSKQVAFFGCSHANNEENYVYRKLIANFGTSNTEHQARI